MTSTTAALDLLRNRLLALTPAGAKGFEGLVGAVLAALTGLTFRLAKASFQAGRDGSSTPSDDFAIAFEAKRYSDDIRLETLAGKAALAGAFVGGDVDLWVVGATAEIGDLAISELTPMLEREGVSVLALDWTQAPLPRLATALAGAKDVTLDWWRRNVDDQDLPSLRAALDLVRAAPGFDNQLGGLRDDLSRAAIGLDALRLRNVEWVEQRLSDPWAGLVAFGQRISVARDDPPVILRTEKLRELDLLAAALPDSPAVLAVLGAEGDGKTWLAAQWWASLHPRPILVIASGRLKERLNPTQPRRSLAALLAQQTGREDDRAVESWERRLRRWQTRPAGAGQRFLVVLDGLNEHGRLPWADIIRGLAPEIRSLGGTLLVTCRESFWRREVLPRLGALVEARGLVVGDFSESELGGLLSASGRKLQDLPEAVRGFVRNPRVCSVALDMLDRLIAQPDELTVDRLLLEYWRARLEERGDAIRHSLPDFKKLLREHARVWLAQRRAPFDLDHWSTLSGLAQRSGLEAAVGDLTEIAEGRFMQADPEDLTRYHFRQEALPFALGLLIVDELKQELRGANPRTAPEAVARILEPVQGFDEVAAIVAAAVGLACLEEGFPPEGRVALVAAWLALQNVPQPVYEAMTAYVAARPEPFLDVAELPAGAFEHSGHSLLGLIAYVRDHPRVSQAIESRSRRWLGAWSRRRRSSFHDGKDAEHQARRDAWLDERLAKLSPDERAYFCEATTEMEEPSAILLSRAIAFWLARRRQARIGQDLLFWAMASELAGDYPDASAELQWVVRLNDLDWAATREALYLAIGDLPPERSEAMRGAIALALRLIGDLEAAAQAEKLSPRDPERTYRRVELFCETDPHDPDAAAGLNLELARRKLAEAEPLAFFVSMSATTLEHDLESIRPALARFDHAPIVEKLRLVLQTAAERTGLPLRQLAWRLSDFAPLMDEASREAVAKALEQVIADPERLPRDDVNWVTGKIADGLIPVLSPAEQLDLIRRLPEDIPLYLSLQRGLKPLAAERLEQALTEARGETRDLTRILFFASGSQPQLNAGARAIVTEALRSEDKMLRHVAAQVAVVAHDTELWDELLRRYAEQNEPLSDADEVASTVGRTLAMAVVDRHRPDLVRLVPRRYLGWVAGRIGGAALEAFGRQTEAILAKLGTPLSVQPPPGVAFYATASDEPLETTMWCEDRISQSAGVAETFKRLADVEGEISRYAQRQEIMLEQLSAYETALSREDAMELARHPHQEALRAYAKAEPDRVRAWLMAILDTTGPAALGQLANLGLMIASAYSQEDPGFAAKAFALLRDADPPLHLLIGPASVPLYEHALFSAADAPEIDALRRALFDEALDDAALETAAAAAEHCGAQTWLADYIRGEIEALEPGRIARALTVAGLKGPDPASEEVLERDWGTGFLGKTAKAARESSRRARWAEHWLGQAATATDPIEYWRAAELLVGVADRRTLQRRHLPAEQAEPALAFGEALSERIRKAVDSRSRKLKDTLFGLPGPPSELAMFLRDRLPAQSRTAAQREC